MQNKTAKTIFQHSPKLTSCIWQLFTDQRLRLCSRFHPSRMCPNCPFNVKLHSKWLKLLQLAALVTPGAAAISRLSAGNINVAFPYLVASSGMGRVRTAPRQTNRPGKAKAPIRTRKCGLKRTQTRRTIRVSATTHSLRLLLTARWTPVDVKSHLKTRASSTPSLPGRNQDGLVLTAVIWNDD